MLRLGAHALRRAGGALARGISSTGRTLKEEAAAPLTASQQKFIDKWKSFAPSTMADPKFATDFLSKKEEVAAGPIPAKLTLSFYLPHEIEFEGKKVDWVTIPGTTGDFGVLPGHVPTVSQMRPGVLTVQVEDKETKKYFVSGGFAFVHPDSTTEICAVEAVPVENLDAETVKQGLSSYNNKLASAKDDVERAAAQIGVEVCSAMVSAVESK